MNMAVPPNRSARRGRRVLVAALIIGGGALAAIISTCSPTINGLTKVRTMGVLRVATINSPTTYYIGAGGQTGYEYDLAKGFADRLGVKLEIVLAQSQQEAIDKVLSGAADLGAAGISVTSAREHVVRFTPPVTTVVPELVYRMGRPRPRSIDELNGRLAVAEGGNQAQRLQQLQKNHPDLKWETISGLGVEDLLNQVAEGQLDYTVANSDLVSINQRYYPKLAVAFTLADSTELAWALPPGGDSSLLAAATDYLRDTAGPERDRLRDRHFGHAERIGYFNSVTLAADVGAELPRYRKWFEKAGAANNIDWRLLAAMGYQESRWDPKAVSPTGVRGLMQLTTDTATHLNVANREDPAQSIEGGSRYFRQTLDALPPEIPEPDRSWMALAAYNMGMGHLIDIRKLTRQLGGDPNSWLDVRKNLPLLTQQRWFSKTEYGYARGHEAIAYVTNVRTFYDMLVWMTTDRRPELESDTARDKPKKEKKQQDPLNINSPVF
jgi:membrane-bound lytic murein transglycosylase F